MALGAVLVDRARAIVRAPTGVRVEGTRQYGTVEGAWFRARLTLPPQPETQEPAGGRRRVEKRPTMLYAKLDENGEPVLLNVEMIVEIDSRELGRAFYQLDVDPEPLRKKRTVLGWEVALRRVEDHQVSAQAVA